MICNLRPLNVRHGDGAYAIPFGSDSLGFLASPAGNFGALLRRQLRKVIVSGQAMRVALVQSPHNPMASVVDGPLTDSVSFGKHSLGFCKTYRHDFGALHIGQWAWAQTRRVGMDVVLTACHPFQIARCAVSLHAILMVDLIAAWNRIRDEGKSYESMKESHSSLAIALHEIHGQITMRIRARLQQPSFACSASRGGHSHLGLIAHFVEHVEASYGAPYLFHAPILSYQRGNRLQ